MRQHQSAVTARVARRGSGSAPAAESSPKLGYRRLAAKLAAWPTIPSTAYESCAAQSPPSEQTGSSAAHRVVVLAAYSGPIATGGSPITRINRSEGFPKRATAATWSATAGGIGFGTSVATTPSGTTFAVTKPITAAPWENPPSTILVLGQFAAMSRT